ncbi:MAG TPA: alpha/beta hydrolase [Blastocatellia bacterium]|nr:alpha/beta hydrolase [Blastocatellia bacterium]
MKLEAYTRTVIGALFFVLLVAGAAKSAGLESRFADFNGTKVHYQTTGKGEEALIFVHGWTCNADFWRGQSMAFPGMRVVAVDLPGHGRSEKPSTDYTMSYFARSIEAVMRDAKIKRAVLVGHSMGTPVVRQFYRLYPERTSGLVIVDGGLRPFVPKAQAEAFAASLRANYKAVASQMVNGILMPIKDEKIKEEIRSSMLATPDYVAVSAMMGMADDKIYERDPIKVPVLAVLAKSPFWQPDTEQFLRSLAPNLEFHMWEGVSHFLMMEKPQEFNRTLQAFLAKNGLLKN